jgi:hypothetical protein
VAVVDTEAPPRPQARFGERPKKKLAPHPDPRRFATTRHLCRLRREEGLGTTEIVKLLTAEPDRYPIEGRWTKNLVDGLLANPKLTGYQVYNRKAARTGRPGQCRQNPIEKWVWSRTPVHEPVISLQQWKRAQEVTAELKVRRAGGGPLLDIRAVAGRLGLDVTEVTSGATHAVYRIGQRQVVLPVPVPDAIARQLIADLETEGAQ